MTPFHIYLYGPEQGPLESSFEEAEARLSQLPRLCFEPDGSFVWVGPSGGDQAGKEQVYGMLYDAAGKLRYCDLQGKCSLQGWRLLCQAITGGPQVGLMVLRLPDQVLQDLQSFEADILADSDASAG